MCRSLLFDNRPFQRPTRVIKAVLIFFFGGGAFIIAKRVGAVARQKIHLGQFALALLV